MKTAIFLILTLIQITAFAQCTETQNLNVMDNSFLKIGKEISKESVKEFSKNINQDDRIQLELSYLALDYCFLSHVTNCTVKGMELKVTVPHDNFYSHFSLGQLNSERDPNGHDQLNVRYVEAGVGIKYAINETIRAMGELGYFDAAERESSQSNANSGFKIRFIFEGDISDNISLSAGTERDMTQNSSDYRHHSMREKKPKMYFTRGNIKASYKLNESSSVTIGVSKLINTPGADKSTIDDPRPHEYPEADFSLTFRTKY